MAKICCGGFYLGEGLELNGRTLKATGGSGLPDPSTLTDGTAMMAVNGEWKMQEGYGWTEEGVTTITWDGNIEGKTVVEIEEGVNLVLMSDETPSSIIGGIVEYSDGDSYNITSEYVIRGEWGYIIPPAGDVTVIFEDGTTVDELRGITFEHKGVYFISISKSKYSYYISSLTYDAPSIFHPIDHTLMPEGYGYYGEAFERITWDGNTEGRDALTRYRTPIAYKVSDTILTAEMLNGASSTTNTGVIGGVDVFEDPLGVLNAETFDERDAALFSGAAGEYSVGDGTLVIPSDGTYFANFDGIYITSLTAASVHQFDPELIPSIVPAAPSEDGGYSLTCTVTDGEAVYSWKSLLN